MRTAAGHVHIGWKRSNNKIDLRHFEASRLLVKQLDYMLGVPSVLLDKVCARRMMYGSAGAFRPKKYGAEYRVLSNFWLEDKALMKWVFDSTQAAFNLLEEGVHLSDRFHSPREIINYSRKEDAQGLIDKGLWKYIIDNGVLQ
jgi:hypothetical protein